MGESSPWGGAVAVALGIVMLNLFPESGVLVVAGAGLVSPGTGARSAPDRAPAVGQEIPAAWQAEAYAAVHTSEAFW